MTESAVYILANDSAFRPEAERLSHTLNLPLREPHDLDVRNRTDNNWYLCVGKDGLAIQQLGAGAAGAVRVDFVGGKAGFRRQRQEAKPDLVKAIGLKPGIRPTVWDLTAGLGQDAFTLARYGCDVLLFERHPIVHALLADGIERAREAAQDDAALLEIVQRMQLIAADSIEFLRQKALEEAQVIYIDTMFPERGKSAKVKKEMQLFQQLVGADSDADELLQLALAREPRRVVVKRPRHAPPLANRSPNLVFKGKAVRFDVYALQTLFVAR